MQLVYENNALAMRSWADRRECTAESPSIMRDASSQRNGHARWAAAFAETCGVEKAARSVFCSMGRSVCAAPTHAVALAVQPAPEDSAALQEGLGDGRAPEDQESALDAWERRLPSVVGAVLGR